MWHTELRQRIRRTRQAAGMTQPQVAGDSPTALNALKRIENGDRKRITLSDALMVAQGLGLSWEQLLCGEGPPGVIPSGDAEAWRGVVRRNIRAARTKHEFTQTRLAEACEMNQGAIARIELGSVGSLNVIELNRMAQAMGIRVVDLFDDTAD